MKVTLTESIVKEIESHGEQTYPYECCGFLIGDSDNEGRRVVEIREQDNLRETSQENRYLITPEAYKAAEDYAKETRQTLLGFYHSHPDHPARPSQYDLDHAWPWFSYLILSVQSGEAGTLLGWQMKDDRSEFDPVDLEIKE